MNPLLIAGSIGVASYVASELCFQGLRYMYGRLENGQRVTPFKVLNDCENYRLFGTFHTVAIVAITCLAGAAVGFALSFDAVTPLRTKFQIIGFGATTLGLLPSLSSGVSHIRISCGACD